EHWIVVPRVVGSSPIFHPSFLFLIISECPADFLAGFFLSFSLCRVLFLPYFVSENQLFSCNKNVIWTEDAF
ncbi:MAG: hypothetical protein ACI30I_07940, partial [Parabacteroides sp.]